MILIYSFYIFLFKCILLTVPCLSEATVGGEPGCEVPFIAACSFNYYYYYYFQLNRIFEGLNMLEKSRNFAHARSGENLHLIWVQKWVWQNGSTAPPIHFQRCAPRATVSRTCMKNQYTHVTHQYLPKSLLKQNPKPNRKLVIFN